MRTLKIKQLIILFFTTNLLFSSCSLIYQDCTVTYIGNDQTSGSAPIDTITYSYGSDFTALGKGSLEKEGFTLLWWNTKPDGKGTFVKPGDKPVLKTNNLNLYAFWVEDTYAKNFKLSINLNHTIQIDKYIGHGVTLVIPESISGIPVTTLKKDALRYTAAQNITLSKNITTIENLAYKDCSNFLSVIIPNGVKRIGSSAFDGCRNLRAINIPESVTTIGERAFQFCTSLASIKIKRIPAFRNRPIL